MKTVIRFTATWCGPCKQYKPIFTRWAYKNSDVRTYTVDVDVQPRLAKRYHVASVPSTVVIENDEIKTAAGALTYAQLDSFVNGR